MAGALYAVVFALRLFVKDPSEVITALYVLPIALLAVTYGWRGGIAGCSLAIALLATWVLVEGVDLSFFDWVTRLVPLLAMGLLLGRSTDLLREAADVRRQREVAELRHRQAVEINDTLIQGMAGARWALEAGQVEFAVTTLDETIRLGQHLVSGLIREADMGPSLDAAQH